MPRTFVDFGCAVYTHRKPVLLVWALAILAALPIAPRVFQSLTAGGFASSTLEAFRADAVLSRHLGSDPSMLFVVYTDPSGQLAATDPAFEEQVSASLADVQSLPEVAALVEPSVNPRQIAPDGRAAYASIAIRNNATDARQIIPRLQATLRPTSLQVRVTGVPAFYEDIYEVTESDLRRAEIISIPFAAVALFLVFGSLVAAAVPGLVGGAAVATTLAIMVLLSGFTSLSIYALNLTTMLGLGLGIDYSLFIVSRFREELQAGQSVGDAVAKSVATSGRAVVYSGITVFVGLFGLLLFDIDALRSLGIAGSLVVATCVLAALTLLPALLGMLGSRVDALAMPRLLRHSSEAGRNPHGFWARLAHGVMAHPLATFVPVLVLLVSLGLPFTRVQFGAPDATVLPTNVPSRQGFDQLRAHWGAGEIAPLLLVFQTNDGSPVLEPDHLAGLYDFLRRVQAHPAAESVDSIVTLDPRITLAQYQLMYDTPDVSRIADAYARGAVNASVRNDLVVARVTSRFGQTDERSKDLVRSIRATPPPAGFQMLVGGATAGVVDYADALYAQFPRAALVVLGAIYVVLLLTFRSVVLPAKAIVMNTLSILASYGALVVIFQEGALSNLLHFEPLGYVEASLPIIMFCVLFGLSMDYEVFLLSRVKEAYDSGIDNRHSVAQGLERSGRIITSAAAIVVLVSLSFVAADIVLIKALGLGTAIAVFLDATIVRALLVPATMRLLGDWNWWAPAWLRRILPAGGLHGA